MLGANDGILSTGALVLGVVSAGAGRPAVLTAGLAGVAAGAASMAMGEYVSVSSQRDAELADRSLEERELARDPEGEHAELAAIYRDRGLDADLADQVAAKLMEADPLGAHLRDEVGITETLRSRPTQAAASSFVSFVAGAVIPIAAVAVSSDAARWAATAIATLIGLLALGAVAARLGGASAARGSLRVGVGGVLALAFSAAIGSLLGTAIG